MRTTNSIADRIAHTITSRYNQNVSMIIVGSTGSGKSYAAIQLALEVSKRVAKIKGGVPSDYFDLNQNMSVIDIMKFFDVLENARKWNTVILDDAGIGINARKFQDAINITINNITQTYRTLNLFTIYTVPQMFFVDRVVRHLVEFYIELEGVIAANLSRGKLFEIQSKSRLGSTGKLFYVYPRGNAEKITNILFNKPPDDICEVYDKLREEGALEYKKKSIEGLNVNGKEQKEKMSGSQKVENRLKAGEELKDILKEVNNISLSWALRLQKNLQKEGII